MSIGAIALNGNSGVYNQKTLNYGQGYGNYQNQQYAGNKAIQSNGQFSMSQSANTAIDQDSDVMNPTEQTAEAKNSRKVGDGECQTCKNRKYQDQSDDSGVSYQSPTKLSTSNVASAVMKHEQEHVIRNQMKAEKEGRKIVSQSVRLHTDICPECGKSYVSGGTTRTVTKSDNSNLEEKSKQAFLDAKAIAEKVCSKSSGLGNGIDAIA